MSLLTHIREGFKNLYIKCKNKTELDLSELKHRLIKGKSTPMDLPHWERAMERLNEYIKDIIEKKGIDPSKEEFISHMKSYYLAYLLLHHKDRYDYNSLKENTYWYKYITDDNIDSCFYKITPSLICVAENTYVIGVQVEHKTETTKPHMYAMKDSTYYDIYSFETIRVEEDKDFDLEEHKQRAKEVAQLWKKTMDTITDRNCVNVLELEEEKGNIDNGALTIKQNQFS